MLTPLIMIALLVMPSAIHFAVRPQIWRADPTRSAALGIGLLFLLTASAHFTQTDSMVQMLPGWVPARELLVLVTGGLEIAIAIAVLLRRTRAVGAWAAIALLIAFFPANVYAALNHIPLGAHAWGPSYLLIRAPLQMFILWWIYAQVLRKRNAP